MAETKTCDRCGGSGKIYVDDLNVRECLCLYRKSLAAHLLAQFGPAVKTAKPVYDSPLYREPTSPGLPSDVDKTGTNLFLKGWWPDLLGHFRWALGSKGPLYPFAVTTDERVRTVYVGNESYTARPRKVREDVETFNSLHDLIGVQHKLVILRLGFLGYSNKAVAGAILESLRIREVGAVATWVVEEPNSIFGPGHLSYSHELAEYLSRFEEIDLVRDPDRPVAPRGLLTSETGMLLDHEESVPTPRQLPASPRARPNPPDSGHDPILMGSPKRGSYGRKGRSSGPLGDE